MRILGIDTATTIASAALLEDEQILAEQTSLRCGSLARANAAVSRHNHAETLLSLVESVLTASRLSVGQLSGIAVSIGPGSFTGLRIGLSTVKGLAYGWDVPVVAVSTLLANAARVSDFQGSICSLFDAKKNEVYASVFHRRGKGLTRITEDFVLPAVAAVERIKIVSSPSPYLFIGDAAMTHQRLLREAFGDKIQLSSGDSYHTIAASVARLGVERLRRSEVQDVGPCVPAYLSLSEAEIKQKIKS